MSRIDWAGLQDGATKQRNTNVAVNLKRVKISTRRRNDSCTQPNMECANLTSSSANSCFAIRSHFFARSPLRHSSCFTHGWKHQDREVRDGGVQVGLSILSSHSPCNGPYREKDVERSCSFRRQQSHRLCDRVAHVAVRLCSGECLLYLHKRVQPAGVVKGGKINPNRRLTRAVPRSLAANK